MVILRLVWRLLRAHPARVAIILLALAVAVAGRVAIGTAIAGVEAGMARESRQFLGGDLEIAASRPWTEDERRTIRAALPVGVQEVEVRSVLTMASAGDQAFPVELRGIGPGYPLIGRLEGAPAGPLGENQVIAEPDLPARLKTEVGGTVTLGGRPLTLKGTVAAGSDAGSSSMALGPRALVTLATLERSGLADRGSRQRFLWLAVLPPEVDATALAGQLRTALGIEDGPEVSGGPEGRSAPGLRIRSATEAQRENLQALGPLSDFLRLTAVLALILGALGVITLIRGVVVERAEDLALLRLLGATRIRAGLVILLQGLALGLAGGLLGALLGAGAAHLLALALAGLLPGGMPSAWHPPSLLAGVGIGGLLGAVAGLPAVLVLLRQSPWGVLRGEAPDLRGLAWPSALVLAVVILLAALDAGLRGGVVVVVLAVVAGGLSLGFRWLLPRVARLPLPRRGRIPAALAAAVANLGRPGLGGAAAATALAGAGLLVGVLLILRASLLVELAPDRVGGRPALFVIDIQVDEVEAVQAELATLGAQRGVILAPVVRARLRHAPAPGDAAQADLARRFRDREQNLSFRPALSADEQLVEGVFSAVAPRPEASLEERWAKRLGYRLGDPIRFDIQGVPIEATVTSIRRVRWTSLRPNFMILLSTDALQDAPQTWIATVADLDAGQRRQVQARLLERFPGLTVLDVDQVAARIDGLVTRIGEMVQVIAALAVAAGLVLLAGLALVSARARRQEAALYRVLGADRGALAVLVAGEFLILGLVSAGAGLTTAVLVAALALPWVWTVPLVIPVVPLGVAVLAIAFTGAGVGLVACLGVLRSTPAEVLAER